MIPLPVVTDDIVSAFLACRYKGFLKLSGDVGEPTEYQRLYDRLDAEYRAHALARPPARPGRPRKDPRPADAAWPPRTDVRLTVVEGDEERHLAFWADTPDQEPEIFRQFPVEVSNYRPPRGTATGRPPPRRPDKRPRP